MLKTSRLRTWIVLCSDETKINLFGSDGVKRVAATRWGVQRQVCLAYSQAWWWECMSTAGTGELQFIEGTMNANMYCDILKQSMIPFLRRLGRRAVFQHYNNPKHTSKTTTALLKKLRVKVSLWGIPKRKVEERKVSNIHQLRDVIMEEWKRTPVATCGALVNSMPKKVKAVLENNGGHTKYWHFGPNLDIFT